MEFKVLEKIAEQQEKTIKLLSRLSEQKYDEKIGIDRHTAFVKNRIFQVRTKSPLKNLSLEPAMFIHVIPIKSALIEQGFHRDHLYTLSGYTSNWYRDSTKLLLSSEGAVKMIECKDNIIRDYVQYLRSGVMEAYVIPQKDESTEQFYFEGDEFKGKAAISIKSMVECMMILGIEGPFNVYISFIDCQDVIIRSRESKRPAVNSFTSPPFTIDDSSTFYNSQIFSDFINDIRLIFGKYE
mgnify:CR=1 FL=1